MIIPYSEIQEILKDCYVNDGKKLRVKYIMGSESLRLLR